MLSFDWLPRSRTEIRVSLLVLLLGTSLGCRSSSGSAPARLGTPADAGRSEQALPSSLGGKTGAWYGIYLGGRKAGWAAMQLRTRKWAGRSVREIHSRMEMRATYGGLEVTMKERSSRFYEAKPPGLLLGIERQLQQGPVKTSATVRRSGKKMVAIREISGRRERRELPASRETIDHALFGASRVDLRQGQVLRGYIFWEDALRDYPVVTRVLSMKHEYLGGVRMRLARIRTDGLPLGLRLEGTVTPSGEVVVAQVGPMSLRLEGETTAKAPYALSNLLDINPKVKRLPSRRPAVVRLRVRGLPAELAHNDNRQTFEKQPDGSYLVTLRRLGRPSTSSPKIPVRRAALARFLQPTATLQADHPEMRKVAREAVGEERDAFRAGLRLRAWVRSKLRTTWHRTTDALTALRAGGGMCYEFAHVLASLARAAGIPARLAYGLVYAETRDGAVFGGHAWTELWVGEWIPFDATEPRGPSVGPHLKLGDHRNPGAAIATLAKLRLDWE